MTLPSSGNLSFSAIQGEFTGSNPISLSEYYKGGSYVGTNPTTTSIPTSGQISVSQFYGARKADVTPAAVNWNDIIGGLSGVTNNQTITGIDTTITLTVSYSDSAYQLYYQTSGAPIEIGGPGHDTTFDVVSGDVVRFLAAWTDGNIFADTVSVINVSDSNTVIDTFAVTLTDF